MIFQLDTNIIFHYMKQTKVMEEIETKHSPFSAGNDCWINVVSIGEIRSIALCNNWGIRRMAWIESFLAQLIVADINSEEILEKYAEVEAYSQCRLPSIKVQPHSPRNMGKNDLWIAATASILEAKLLTTDHDFDHLSGVFLDLERFDIVR